MTIHWQSEIYPYLLQEQYSTVADYYEQRVEQEPENPKHYWYLGLAYLLLGQEEQAQLTWFIVLSQCEGEELENHIQSLTDILDAEADRNELEHNYQIAWLIRGHLREISPNDYNNLLQFACLDIVISNSAIQQLESWDFSKLLPSISKDKISEKTLNKFLSYVSKVPSTDSLFLIRYCLEYGHDAKPLIATIINSTQGFISRKEFPKYTIEVLNICLEYEPNNLSFINAIFLLYDHANEIDGAIKTAEIALNRSQNITEKAFSYYQLLSRVLKASDWHRGLKIKNQYLQVLKEFIEQEIDPKYIFIIDAFVVVNQPIYYLRDNPIENRLIGNYISQAFQKTFLAQTNVKTRLIQNSLICERPLKIGYIGHTLHAHPVGFLCRWLINHSNKNNIKNYGYMIADKVDDFAQEWFVSKMENYTIFPRDVQSIINQIQADEIDILIDLDAWTYDLTCQVMALKPAPIQVTWLGFDASGIPNVDYFIADPYVLPDNAQDYYSEKIWRLPNCYLGIDGFEIGVPTLRREDLNIPQDAVIFANYQNAFKRHPHILHQQMKILKAVPNSYLLVKGTGKADAIEELFKSIAEEENVALERLHFLEPCATEMEHRANLGIVDVILDTYPYNGATSTLETLWMGIPLVTRVGEQFAARNSYTFMMNVGITEGIAWTDEEYVEWGIKLGTDAKLRQEIKWKLMQSRQNSPLWNGKQFAHEMENAYRQMWEIYLQTHQH